MYLCFFKERKRVFTVLAIINCHLILRVKYNLLQILIDKMISFIRRNKWISLGYCFYVPRCKSFSYNILSLFGTFLINLLDLFHELKPVSYKFRSSRNCFPSANIHLIPTRPARVSKTASMFFVIFFGTFFRWMKLRYI